MAVIKISGIPEIDAIAAALNKKFSKDYISMGPRYEAALPLETGSTALDTFIGIGGIPRGRIIEIFGAESCLSADTRIQYNVVRQDGSRANSKGGTIQDLYYRFHNLPRAGTGKYQREITAQATFTVPSVNEAGCIFHNTVVDVVKTGVKRTYVLTTSQGYQLRPTAEHKFMTPDGFQALDQLELGSTVLIHNNNLENLLLIDASIHNRQHALDNHRFVAQEDTVSSIEEYGEEETYDIRCLSPHNNYIANDLVVHNSGKTSLCLKILSNYQADKTETRPAVIVDIERSIGEDFMKGFNVDPSKVVFVYPDTAEEGLQAVLDLNKAGVVGLIVIDSVDGLQNSQWLKKNLGDSDMQGIAKLMGQVLRQVSKLGIDNKVTNIFINQIRDSLDMYGPKSTTPGGKALRFYASLRLELMRNKASPNMPNAFLMRVKQVKNKVASPKLDPVEIDFVYGKGPDMYHDLLTTAKNGGIIRYAGTSVKLAIPDQEIITLCTGGKSGAYDHLANNPEAFQKLKEACLALIEVPTNVSVEEKMEDE